MLDPLVILFVLSKFSYTSNIYATNQRLETFIFLMILKTNIILLYILNTCALSQSYPHSKNQACHYFGKAATRVTLILDSLTFLLNTFLLTAS